MAESPDSPTPPPSDSPAERIDTLRRELVAAELQILELNDRLLAKDTDRADAVALLGQAELVLEEKIGYIMTLDQALNRRIRELEAECDRKSAEIDRRGEAITAAQTADERHRAERDAVIRDLSERLEAANQEINRAHELARDFAAKADTTAASLGRTQADLDGAREQLAATTADLEQTRTTLHDRDAELADARNRLEDLSRQINDTTARLSTAEENLAAERGRLHAIKHSVLWRWGRPWRALFGPKV